MSCGLTMDEIMQLSDDLPPITQQDVDAAIVTTWTTVTKVVLKHCEKWTDQLPDVSE